MEPNPAPITPLPSQWWRALVHPWTWRMAWRDSRTQRRRLLVFALAIVAGLSALVTIHALKGTLQRGVELQAKSLLGSDLLISARDPLTAEQLQSVTREAQASSREIGFSSNLLFLTANAARLVQVRGVEGGYPYYGEVQTEPADAWPRLHREPGIILERTLLEQYGAKVGDKVKLGTTEFTILGTVAKPLPRTSGFGAFAPEVYTRLEDLQGTGLLQTASLSWHHLHLKMPTTAAAQIKREFETAGWRFETPENRRDGIENALEKMQQFLGIIALVALVLGGIGVAGAVHAHVRRRQGAIAILRCLGCPADLAFSIYLVQTLVLGLAGAALGIIIGVALHMGVVSYYRDLLPVALDIWPPLWAVVRPGLAGLAICLGFALVPLLRVRHIPPASSIREEPVHGSSRATWIVYTLLAVLLAALAMRDARDWKSGLGLVAGLAVAMAALAGTARALTHLARKTIRSGWPYVLRQGVANLYRPRNQTLLFLFSLGLGTFLLVTILLSRTLLLERVNLQRFAETPSLYLIDVQPDQVEGVRQTLRQQQLSELESAPMVTMRLASVRGVPAADLAREGKAPKWVLQREFRSTYRTTLNATEKLIAGEWKMDVPATEGTPVPVSLEQKLAKDLNVSLGDEIEMDVQGVPVRARVASLREVDWSRFNLNFFMVFPPSALEGAPGFTVITTKTPSATVSGTLQRELARQFPNVSAIDLTLIISTVQDILEKVTKVVTILAAFTVLAAIPILLGSLLNGRDQRLRESVLLRTLGASARQIRTILLVEYAALGGLAALSGVILAAAGNWALATWVFEASRWPSASVLAGAFVFGAALAILSGALLSRGLSTHPPLAILRRT